MRSNFFLFFLFSFIVNQAIGQVLVQIKILDDKDCPIKNVVIKSIHSNKHIITDSMGLANWKLDTVNEKVQIQHIGYESQIIQINKSTPIIRLKYTVVNLEEAQIIASWVKPTDIIVHTSLHADQLKKEVLIQDIPQLIQHLPSSVSSSDAGNGVGYTGIRIRGMDPSQINVLVNGIPFNDAESQGVFWVDMPDIIASASEIQVQRGIGLSGSGQAAFGASILINTNIYDTSPGWNLEAGLGSYGTNKISLRGTTGWMKNNIRIRGRISRISSQGYVDRAESNLLSGNISFSKIDTRRKFQFHYFDGLEKTYQSWYGLPVQYLKTNRTFNVAGTEKKDAPYEKQIDHYRQSHFQFLHSQELNNRITWNNTFHYTPGNGYYEEYKADQTPSSYLLDGDIKTDIVRRKLLASHFLGSIHSVRVKKKNAEYQMGGSWNNHSGRHYGQVIKRGSEILTGKPLYYDGNANKFSSMFFGKGEWHLYPLTILGDLQYRSVYYRYTKADDKERQLVDLHFFNPKIGFSLEATKGLQLFTFSGLAHREPNRNDYIDSDSKVPLAEKLWDNELGYRLKSKHWSVEQNLYYMKYTNQLIPTGRLNDVGAYVRSNVPKSYRLGLESSMQYTLKNNFRILANLTLSQNKTSDFREYVDNWDLGRQEVKDHLKKSIAFSPAIISNIQLESPDWVFIKGLLKNEFNISLDGQYVGAQYVDGSESSFSKLPAYHFLNSTINYSFKKNDQTKWQLQFRWNNITNELYEANGWIYRFKSPSYNPVADDPYTQSAGNDTYSQKGLYPQAGSNVLVTAQLFFN